MPSKSNQNLYDILGIESRSDDVEIKKAYRKKVLTCHPDKNPNNPKANELFHQITTAYTVLIDPESRKNYDEYLLTCDAIRYVCRRMEYHKKSFKHLKMLFMSTLRCQLNK